MRRLLLVLFLPTLLGCHLGHKATVPEIVNPTHCDPAASPSCHALEVDGVTRTYLLHVPKTFRAGESALVIALHGGGGNAETLEKDSQLNETADREGFIVAYPEGLIDLAQPPGLFWNYYYDDYLWEKGHAPDDVAFIRALIAQLHDETPFDRRRVYATGFSAGGYMLHRLAIELSDEIAAIGIVEGWMGSFAVGDERTVPPASGPVSVLMVDSDHGAYCGWRGQGWGAPLNTTPGHDAEFDFWAGPRGNHCASLDTTKPLCDAHGRPTKVVSKHATACAGGSEVRFYRMIQGRHSWPHSSMNVSNYRYYNPDLDETTGVTLNEVLWRFFASHPKT